jgi:transposase
MGKKRVLTADEKGLKALKNCESHHYSPLIRQRCRIVLLKIGGHTNESIQRLTGSSYPTITGALDKYEFGYAEKGIKCMENASGQGRKAALLLSDGAMVRAEVVKERQRLSLAKAIIEEKKGQKLSDYQLRTFLKSLVGNTNESVE